VDPDKIAFLFGTLPEWADPDDREDRAALVAEELGIDLEEADPEELFHQIVAETLATQVAEDDPPEVWAAARRLGARGLDRRQVARQLKMTLATQLQRTLTEEKPFDEGTYVAALERLPLPRIDELWGAMLGLARERPGIEVDDLEQAVAERFGFDREQEPYASLVERVSDLLVEPDGPLTCLHDDKVVAPVSLCGTVVLTHRLTEAEIATGRMDVGVDLIGFARLEDPLRTTAGEELYPASAERWRRTWEGPQGWLARYEPGTLLAVRYAPGRATDPDGSVLADAPDDGASDRVLSIEALTELPAADEELVALVRAAYDKELDGLPVSCEDVLLSTLLEAPGSFAEARPPLGELLRAAGLELRRSEVAHSQEIWRQGEMVLRLVRVMARLDEQEDIRAVTQLVEAFEVGDDGAEDLRRLLHPLRGPEVLEVAADELLGTDEDPRRAVDLSAFARRLVEAARQPADAAVARWLLALAYERSGQVEEAERQLQRGLQLAPSWGPLVDRAAWYCSDRGRAEEAVRLWRRLGLDPEDHPDLELLTGLLSGREHNLGRNEVCWCGSGRKYKHCHLGRPAELSLAERFDWLRRKVMGYMERRGGAARRAVQELAGIVGGDDGAEELEDADSAGVVADIALVEGGWFRRFLDERGALLPDDEALLLQSWALVDRTLYEVVTLGEHGAAVLRDLRSGEQLRVVGSSLPNWVAPGGVLGARALPVDGEGSDHRLAGFAFRVPPGAEPQAFEVLDSGDAEELAAFLGAFEAPPAVHTREGEPLVLCWAVFELPDPDGARVVLDRLYQRRDDEEEGAERWVEVHELAPDDTVLRARLQLDGSRLRVETTSEIRLERVMDALRAEIPGLGLVVSERTPAGEALARAARRGDAGAGDPVPEVDPAVVAQLQERFERRWCDESVPALGGLTPRQAAAEPAARETLERLLRDFEQKEAEAPPGGIVMRARCLRELLGVAG
jgi:tetratricopeptide (TPR) repeat protein